MIGAPIFRYALTPGWAGDSLARAAQAVPSLDLNFAVTKNVGPLVSFTRASTATYIDSAGTLQTAAVDVPRFDHNPTTGESLGLLVEEARTNLLLRSEEFDNASWAKSNITISANSVSAPNGTVTADTLTDSNDGAAAAHSVITPTQSFTSGLAYTVSVYAQAGSLDGIAFIFPSAAFTSNLNARFNISTGTIQNLDSGLTGSITAVGGGWYRCSATATATATASNTVQIRTATASSSFYQGNGTGTIFLWGAQLEAGAFPTSYIPTTTAAATRNADVASITGTNFSSWYRQDEGTIYGEYIITVATSDGTLTSFDDGTANNRWQQRFTSIGQRYRLQSGGVSLVDDISTSAPLINATNKVAHAIRAGDQRHAGNGLLNAIALIASPLPTVTQLQIATGPGAGNAGRITIRRLTYWPTRLPDSTLQAITQ
jgi:hypothetical protein